MFFIFLMDRDPFYHSLHEICFLSGLGGFSSPFFFFLLSLFIPGKLQAGFISAEGFVNCKLADGWMRKFHF